MARLHLAIEGEWTALDFGQLFETFGTAYLAASCSESLTDFTGWDPVHVGPPRGYYVLPESSVEQLTEGLVVRANILYGDLAVTSAEYSSPGWLGFAGSLNPLKVVADFITDWRAENSQRRRDEAAAHAAGREADLQEAAERHSYEIRLMEQLSRLPAQLQAPLLNELYSRWPERELKAIARDRRLGEVRVAQIKGS